MLGRRTALLLRPKVRAGNFFYKTMSEVIIFDEVLKNSF